MFRWYKGPRNIWGIGGLGHLWVCECGDIGRLGDLGL